MVRSGIDLDQCRVKTGRRLRAPSSPFFSITRTRSAARFRVVDRQHGGDEIDRRHVRLAIAHVLHHDVAGQHRDDLTVRDALLDADATRFKPILLIALAAMIGAGFVLADPIFQSLAISLVFGLASSTALTLRVIPAIYVWLRDDLKPPRTVSR